MGRGGTRGIDGPAVDLGRSDPVAGAFEGVRRQRYPLRRAIVQRRPVGKSTVGPRAAECLEQAVAIVAFTGRVLHGADDGHLAATNRLSRQGGQRGTRTDFDEYRVLGSARRCDSIRKSNGSASMPPAGSSCIKRPRAATSLSASSSEKTPAITAATNSPML